MLPSEVAKKIRRIQIHSNKIVNQLLAGEYHSVFKGRGMEFEEVRPYQPGDEVRWIDWNVTARTGEPYVKRYVEERELVLFFLVDFSASGGLGTVERTKNEIAAEVCAVLAFSAIQNNDKVALVLFTDHIELFVPPKKGSSHVLRIIRELLCFQPVGRGTNLADALRFVGRAAKKKSIVFLVSDFQADGWEDELQVVARRHDVIAVSVRDPREVEVPTGDLLVLEDPETGRQTVLDARSRKVRQRYQQLAAQQHAELRLRLQNRKVDLIDVRTDRDYVPELVRFFRQRERRLAGAVVG